MLLLEIPCAAVGFTLALKESVLRKQITPPQQVLEARVRSKSLERRIHLSQGNAIEALW
jgi:hypothetical protein